jgi:hypothetical protein
MDVTNGYHTTLAYAPAIELVCDSSVTEKHVSSRPLG